MTGHKTVAFGTRFLGLDNPVAVIAEIGINHEGDAEECMRLIRDAARAGADAIKLQTLDADENYVPGTESHDLFSRAWLGPEDTAAAFRLARSLGMEALTTCGDLATLAWVEALSPAAHKISSGLLTHLPLIAATAATKRTLIMSTGMSDLPQVTQAVGAARAAGNENLCLLQCTSIYPAEPEMLNLAAIRILAETFGVPCGFSDHSIGQDAAALAVAAGACVIEKHFSSDPSRPGFDHRLSVDAEGLAALVTAVRRAEAIMGSAAKSRSAEQVQAGTRYFRSIVARRDIDAGEVLSLENVGFMRTLPQQRGAEPARWEQWCGRRTLRPLRRYQAIRPEDLEQGEPGK